MQWRSIFVVCSGVIVVACSGGSDRTTAGEPAPNLSDKASPALHILVIGGTSGIGLETVKFALDRGHTVTAMARRPERMTLTHERLETIKGDILDGEGVKAAVQGHDAIVTAIGVGLTRKPVSVFSQGTRNVLVAMQAAGIDRLIAVTGIGAGDSRGHGGFWYDRILQPLLLKTMYEDKDREEALIRASHTNWTIVRPGFLNDDASETRYRVISDLDGITSGDIARADVAHFIVAALEARSFLGTTVLLTNL
jgi:putative NADH-flavin reductase